MSSIPIGTIHVPAKEDTDKERILTSPSSTIGIVKISSLHHTSYAADWRRYRQEAQDVTLYMSVEGGYTIPMPRWLLAQWQIVVIEEHIFNNLFGCTSSQTSTKVVQGTKDFQTYVYCLKYLDFTPDEELPDYPLLLENRIEWAKKVIPTWDDVEALAQKLKREAQGTSLKVQ